MMITKPDDPAFSQLCEELRQLANSPEHSGVWPAKQLELCAQYGVFRWFVAEEFGGFGWNASAIAEGYLRLSSACLTTTFVITQRTGACKRIYSGVNEPLKAELLPQLAEGKIFSTVGISHLTTSRRHLEQPVLRATESADQYLVDGSAPWVTGGAFADHLVVGAVDQQGTEVLFCLPTDLAGISFPDAFDLIALNGSRTGQVVFDGVLVDKRYVIAGPAENVLSSSPTGETGAGGLQTSVLAVGLTTAVIDYLRQESDLRGNLVESFQSLEEQHERLRSDLLHAIQSTEPMSLEFSKDELRRRANSLLLRTTQAAMVAAKGAGFVKGHPVGRWCQEALFFLVWSCPQSVSQANLCEFAGIAHS